MNIRWRKQRLQDLYSMELNLWFTRQELKRFPNKNDLDKHKESLTNREIDLRLHGIVLERNKHRQALDNELDQ